MPKPVTGMLSLDVEATGVDLHHGCKPFMVSTCDEQMEQNNWAWPVDPVTREPQVDRADLLEIAKAIRQAKLMVLQNPRFDVRALQVLFDQYKVKFKWSWDRTVDTLMAGHILASNQPHDLATMALIYCGINIQPLEDTLDEAVQEATKRAKRYAKHHNLNWQLAKPGLPCMPSTKKNAWKCDMWLPALMADLLELATDHHWRTVCADYNNGDSASTLLLYKAQIKLLEDRGLLAIYNKRLELLPVIYDIESHGVTVCKSRMDALWDQYTATSEQLENRCKQMSGGTLEKLPKAGTSNQLSNVLFDQLKLPVTKRTPTKKPSVDKFVIDEWLATTTPRSKQHIFVKSVKAHRKRQTALGYIKTYRKHMLPLDENVEEWYRLFCSLNPTGTDTLRWSSSNPNSQQFSKQEIAELDGSKGHSARYMLGPAPGREWWACDAKNIELRIPAYVANELEMVDLFERMNEPPYYGSVHLLMFDTLHPDMFAKHGAACKDVYDDTWYQWTKNGDFAVQYGSVEESGTADRAYHMKGAFNRIKSRFTRIHGPGGLNEQQIAYADQHGYIVTLPDSSVDPDHGYPLLCTRNRWGRIKPTVPLNYFVQGTAMWWMMMAMIRCHKQLEEWRVKDGFDGRITMQVHDELVFDFPKSKVHPSKDTGAFRRSNKWRIRKLMDLMELGGKHLGVPLPVSCKYHEHNWSEGVSV